MAAKLDFNNDGKSDILFQNANGAIDVWTMNGTTPIQQIFVSTLDPSWIPTTGASVFGVTGVLYQDTNGSIDIWEFKPNSIATPSEFFIQTLDPTWHAVASADFNGDGIPDQLFQSSTNNSIDIWTSNALNPSHPIAETVIQGSQNLDPSWHIVGAADFNGDGKADILFQNSGNNAVDVWLMNGPTVTTFGPILTTGSDPNWKVVGTGDFNGPGQTDILFQNSGNGAVDVWTMNGATVASYGPVLTTGDPNWKVVGTGDFNGDGKTDILFQNSSNNAVDVWLMNGGTVATYGPILTTGPDPNWKVAGIADYNGDGMSDILFQNSGNNAVDVWTMNGATPSSYGPVLTTGPDPNWHVILTG